MFYMEDESTQFGNEMKLCNRNGYYLQITPCREICGTEDLNCQLTHIQVLSGGNVGLVRLQGIETKLYVCFDSCGQLFGECDPENPETIFREELHGSYNAYRSVCHPEWFIGIKKDGSAKPGPRTAMGQKATKFLPQRL